MKIKNRIRNKNILFRRAFEDFFRSHFFIFFIMIFYMHLVQAESTGASLTAENIEKSEKVENIIETSEENPLKNLKEKIETQDFLSNEKISSKDVKENQEGELVSEVLEAKPTPMVEFVVDSSGSMGQLLTKKKTRIYILKKLLSRYLLSQWNYKTSSGLRLFGSRREKDCKDNYLAIKPGDSKLGAIDSVVRGLQAVGKTPITTALEDAFKDVKDYPGPQRIILFTDGEETCGRNPCKAVEEIKKKSVDLSFFVVALGLKDQTDTLLKLQCIGPLTMADDEEQLNELFLKLDKELNPNKNLRVESPEPKATVFLYRAESPEIIYRKFEAQMGIEVPPGDYIAVVDLKPKYKFKQFKIPKGRSVTLKVKGTGLFLGKFREGLLKIEFRNKENKVIKSIKSDQLSPAPIGRWTLKILREPFFEKIIEDFLIVPDASYEVSIEDAGVLYFSDPKIRGLYVYDGQNVLKGNFLTNYPFVLKNGLYSLKLDEKCIQKEILVSGPKNITKLSCQKNAEK